MKSKLPKAKGLEVRPAPEPPGRSSKRLAPIVGAATALGAALVLRQLIGGVGLAQPTNVYTALNVTGVLTLGVLLAYWAGKLTGKLPAALLLGGLSGTAAACFAHETIPAIAGGVILGFFGFRIVAKVLNWAVLYVVALLYGGGVGVGAHYLITTRDGWGGYPQAGLAVLVGVGVAAYLASCFGEEETNRRFAAVWNTWIRANRFALVGSVMLGLSGSLYGLRGQDLNELASKIRAPIEQKVAEFKEVTDNVEAANDFKGEVERILGGASDTEDITLE